MSRELIPLSNRELDQVFKRPIPKYFNKPEIDAILSANAYDVRAHLVVNTLWKTGFRCSELTSLRREDFDPYGKALRASTLKQGLKRTRYGGRGRPLNPGQAERVSERIITIPDDLVVSLASWAHHAKTESLFPFSRATVYRIVNNACRRAGIRDGRAHPHTFRHSYAVHLLREGVPVTVLRDLLGHSNFSNTLIYLRIIQPDRDIILRNVKW